MKKQRSNKQQEERDTRNKKSGFPSLRFLLSFRSLRNVLREGKEAEAGNESLPMMTS